MNTTSDSHDIGTLFSKYLLSQQKMVPNQTESTRPPLLRPTNQHQYKALSHVQMIELCTLCLILVEQTILFLLTFHKKSSKEILFDPK